MVYYDPDKRICQNCDHWRELSVWHTGQCRAQYPGEGASSTGVDWHGSDWVHTHPSHSCEKYIRRLLQPLIEAPVFDNKKDRYQYTEPMNPPMPSLNPADWE